MRSNALNTCQQLEGVMAAIPTRCGRHAEVHKVLEAEEQGEQEHVRPPDWAAARPAETPMHDPPMN